MIHAVRSRRADSIPPALQLSVLHNIPADESVSRPTTQPPGRHPPAIYTKTSFWGIVITSFIAVAIS